MIFVAAVSENKLFQIDPMKMIKSSETSFFCEGVHSIKVDHNRQFIYTADTYSKSISAVDMIKNERATAGSGTSPTHLEFCKKNGLLYVANYDSDSVSLINAETLENVMTIKTESMPHHIAISDDENYIYVLQMGSNSILAIDTFTNEISGRIRLKATPMHMQVGKSTDNIYIACTNFEKTTSGEIIVVDKKALENNISVKTLNCNDKSTDKERKSSNQDDKLADKDGKSSNQDDKLAVKNSDTSNQNDKLKRYKIGTYLFDLCVVEKDMTLYAVDGQENKLYMISLVDGQIINEVKTGEFPSTIEYDRESDRIFVGTHIENLIEAYDRKDLTYLGRIEFKSEFGHIAG